MKIKKRRILTARTNQYGDIAIWENKNKDGKIVHVSGQRLTVTCKARGIDFRRCFKEWGGSRAYPSKIYDGVYVDVRDYDRLQEAIKERNARSEQTAEYRNKRREKEDETLRQEWVAELRQCYPNIPDEDAKDIAFFATVRGSGRIGRSSSAEDPVKAAVIAHIRHNYTDYDNLLADGEDKYYARGEVGGAIANVYRQWEVGENKQAEQKGGEI